MSQRISSFQIGTIFYQSGYGYPTHIATRGCTYIDVETGTEYINKDGIVDWVPFLDGSTVITGGTTTGDYLPLSGGTVSGATTFTSGITVNTISDVDYINFKTSPIVPNPTGGTLYFDSNENALSYKPVTNQNDVTVNLGQEGLIRIYNNLGYQINNGQVLHITGATSGIPTVALANASKLGTAFTESIAQTSGVATHDIPNGQFGFMTNFGIVRDLNTSGFTAGQEVFLSDTVDGALTNDPNNLAFTSRVSTVGYCLESSPTNGKILVVITNENPLQSLTQQEVNVLLGNVISTGAYFYTGATTASSTTINVSPVRGWIVYNTGPTYSTNPLVLNVYYSGGTNIPITGLTNSFDTYLMVTSGGTLYQTTSYPTPIERRQNIFLGRVVHPNKTTILNVEQSVDFDVSPYSSLRDLWVPLKLINENVVPSPNGATLTFKTSAGTFWGNGIGFPTNELNPNSITVPAYTPASFYYTTQTGGTFTTTTTTVDTTKYDVGGVAVNVPGSGNYSTQRIYMSQSGVIRLQYGQNYYSTLAKAIAAIPSETFVTNPDNGLDCILIGLLTVKDGTSDLSNTDDAIFTFVSKFGDLLGGTGGIATTTLQQAYNNSVPPEILTNSTLGALSIQNGTGSSDNVSNLFEGLNTAGSITSFIRADGTISGTTLLTNGFRANNNGITATTISATSVSLPFSSGSTLFAGTSGQISQNNSQFFWDNVNNRLGVGTNSPQAKLDVASSTGNTAIHITSSALTNSDINFINSGYPLPRWTIRGGAAANGSSGALVFQRLGGTYVMSITENTNVLIGTATDAGFKLDVNGSTNVTGPSTSDSASLGSELLSSSGWVSSGWTGSYAAGFTHLTGNTSGLTNSLAAVVNNYYQITYTITGRTAGSISVTFGGFSFGATATGSQGPKASTTAGLVITPSSDFDGNVIFSIKIIGTSTATSTWKNSSGTVVNELRASNVNSNVFLGFNAGSRNTTGQNNTLIGQNAGQVNTTGTYNTFIGNSAGANNTIASNNLFVGYQAGVSNTTGANNTFLGYSSGYANTTGAGNVFIGLSSGQANVQGSSNAFVGTQSGIANTNGANNSYLGNNAAANNTAGNNNVAIGLNAGRFISGGAIAATSIGNSIFIGANVYPLADSQTNQIVIGFGSVGLGSNTTVLGNNSTTFTSIYGNVGIGVTTDSGYKLDVSSIARISGDTSIVGNIIQSSTAYTGTHTIGFSANNSVRFTNSGIGQYMQVGPSNVVDFVGQQVRSVQRGANFGSSISGSTILILNALAAQTSGTFSPSGIELTYPINNTGTYSGITRGIFYNPTLTSLVGTTHRAIETVTGDVVLGSTSGSVLVGKTTNDGFRLDVSGTTRLSALTQNILTVIGSGNSTTSPIFSVQGSQGELFSVTDSLTGSLFSVNDISGLPILEVFSDNTTLMGNYLAPSLNTTAKVSLTAGTNTIYSIPVSAYTGAFFDYTLVSTGTTGARAGNIMSIWSGTTVQFTETSTNDIGTTAGVTFSVTSNGTLAQLSSSATTAGWIVETIVRSI